ncbi:MAG TPA: heavy metal translocating P-type ATPase metal-binding domain-containing protein [Vicinamibacterales bacterium]
MLAFPGQLDAPASSVACRHCGDPCGDQPRLVGSDAFCCLGCESVYRLLTRAGLGQYYEACEIIPGVSQRQAEAREADHFAPLDDPAIAAAFVEFDDGRIARARFAIPALHCASCVWLLERLWRIEPGVIASDVDLVRRTVRVTFRPQQITLRAIAERMAALGYEASLAVEKPAGGVSRARRRLYRQLGVAGFAFGNIMIFSIPRYVNGAPLEGGFQRLFDMLNIAFALPVLLFSASDWFRAAWRSLRARHVTLDLPITLGLGVIFARSIVDIASGAGEGFLDSFAGLVFFLLLGRLVQQQTFDRIAFDRTYRSFFPLAVRVERDGASNVVPLEQIAPGDRIVVRPQEVVPADSVLIDEHGAVDYAFVTGESTPVNVAAADTIRAGGRVVGKTLQLRVSRPVSHSQLASLWSHPLLHAPKKAWITSVADRFGLWFTASALVLSAAGAAWWWPDVEMSIRVASAVLLIACPCALTLAAPVTLGTALGQLGLHGLYLRNADVVFDLSGIDTIAFDKTGTLTSSASPVLVEHGGLSAAQWRLVRTVAAESVHPVSRALVWSGDTDGTLEDLDERPGLGVSAVVDGRRVRIGTAAFVGAPEAYDDGRTHVSVDDTFGWVKTVVPVRDGIGEAVQRLAHTHDVQLVSGDHEGESARWRSLFGDAMTFRQSPVDKVSFVRGLQAEGRRVLMVGDGLNDAGALAAADVGIAASDATACVVPACDAIVSGDHLRDLPAYLRYARRARQVIVLSFVLSLVYNAGAIGLALGGTLTPLAAAILMPISSLGTIALAAGGMRWSAGRMLPV